MQATKRKNHILDMLSKTQSPISATSFAENLSVSRQTVVGDIALLRASGNNIAATPRGYVLEKENFNIYEILCYHDESKINEELYAIVDCGCTVIDVSVNHEVYGKINVALDLSSRLDVDLFMKAVIENEHQLLSSLTNDIHRHLISCPTAKHFKELKNRLNKLGLLFTQEEK